MQDDAILLDHAGGIHGAGFDDSPEPITEGDFYIDNLRGSDANDGRTIDTAFASYRRAVKALRDLGSGMAGTLILAVDNPGRPYRERLIPVGIAGTRDEPITFDGYDGGTPEITGAEIAGPFARCGPDREPLLGPAFGKVWEWTFNIRATLDHVDSFAEDKTGEVSANAQPSWGINPYEGDLPLFNATLRAGDEVANAPDNTRFHKTTTSSMIRATRFLGAGGTPLAERGDPIHQIEHTGYFGKLREETLRHAFIRYRTFGNIVRLARILGRKGDVLEVESLKNGWGQYNEDFYNIGNYAWGMSSGEWAVTENGEGTATLYVRPRNEESLDGGITIGVRNQCMMLGTGNGPERELHHVHFENMKFTQTGFGGSAAAANGPITRYVSGGATWLEGIHFRNIYVGKVDNGNFDGRGKCVVLQGMRDVLVDGMTLDKIDSAFGIQNVNTEHVRIYRLFAKDVGQAPIRTLGCTDFIFAWLEYLRCGRAGHSNQLNIYQGSFRGWVHGIRTYDCIGYLTAQRSGRLAWTCGQIEPSADVRDVRCHTDQGLYHPKFTPDTADHEYYYHCNWYLPDRGTYQPGSLSNNQISALIGDETAFRDTRFSGNIVNGLALRPTASAMAEYDRNLHTNLSFVEDSRKADRYPPNHCPNSLVATAHREVFVNAPGGDFTPRSGGPIHAMQQKGPDLRYLSKKLKEWFPDEEVDALLEVDLVGDRIDLARGPVGPLVDPSRYAPSRDGEPLIADF